ncbi:MAG: hypothetical protein A2X52_12835 [Candidatus Rokubacteria bacterium GWC2_70_16]|nr:MAG: hypothetical protein A2X52_12835 [Candidatus Rokubacteria bacterium GWC2_70_16]OGL21228.1 MAG: hypothetical protein A3K12_12235 [Candidatus Rokubacteria bacterium RIFCSPLOWO2_12_FULL_71_19]
MRGPARPSPLAALALTALAVMALGGCARPFISPILPPPYRDQVEAPYDATWKALIRALAADNVPLRTVAKDSGVISSDDIVSPIGVFADCGRLGAVSLEGEALVTFTVFVQANGSSTTDIQVNGKMRTQAHRRGDSGRLRSDPVYQCASTGRWEANLVDVVRRLVKE